MGAIPAVEEDHGGDITYRCYGTKDRCETLALHLRSLLLTDRRILGPDIVL